MEHKTLGFKLTNIGAEGRTVEGIAAAFENIDGGDDMLHPGAFTKTLAERGNKVRFLWQHDRAEPIGKPFEIHEIPEGLFVKAMISDTARGRDALALLRDGAIDSMSIGYDPIAGGTDYTRHGETTVRNLREVKLWEFSLVTFPMNEAAVVTALKDTTPPDEEKAGRVISKRNGQRIMESVRGLMMLLEDAGFIEDEPEPEPETEPKSEPAPTPDEGMAQTPPREKEEAGPVEPPTFEIERTKLLEMINQLEEG